MSTVERLRTAMEKLGIKGAKALSERVGANRNTLQSAMERGSLSEDLCRKISAGLNINYEWLAFGFGPMGMEVFNNGPTAVDISSDRYAYVKKAKARLSAGGGIVPDETYEDFPYVFQMGWLRRVASSPKKCVLMDVSGDSMSPVLESGDMVLVDRGVVDVSQSGVFAFGEGDVINIKELLREGQSIRIISANKSGYYPDRLVRSEEIRVIGRVIWLGRQFR